jgi:hypothetical protein
MMQVCGQEGRGCGGKRAVRQTRRTGHKREAAGTRSCDGLGLIRTMATMWKRTPWATLCQRLKKSRSVSNGGLHWSRRILSMATRRAALALCH